MTQRFLVYPILFIVLMQLAALLRGDKRWFAAQIAQSSVTLLACLGALYFSHEPVWLVIAWGLCIWFVFAPTLLTSVASAKELQGHWHSAAVFRQLAGRVAWGQMGRLYRRYATALGLVARGHTEQALAALEELAAGQDAPREAARPTTVPVGRMPLTIRGMVLTWRLSLLVTLRQWERAVAFHQYVYDWGTLGQATQARLLVARALAETGQIERALRSLQFVALSPRTLGAKQAQLWATRVAVAALAGDRESVEELLRQRAYARPGRRFARFAAYWRGRCALARGELEEAVRKFARAFALTHPRNRLWRDAIMQQLRLVEDANSPHLDPLPQTTAASRGLGSPQGERSAGSGWWAAQDPMYAHGLELLRGADKDTAVWRALMYVGRPARVTMALLLVCAVVHLVSDVYMRGELQDKLLLWAGNTADTVRDGEWWRLFTAMFLHANLLHLAMNGAALWIFGSAVEKTVGWWRYLAVFLLAGALGNLASAFDARYEVAIGASGGIFGVIGAFAVGVWRLRSPMYFALRRRLLLLIVLMVATDFTIGGLEPQVDNLAHVGGFFAGIVIATALWPRRKPAAS
jgi:membrane associated rhomboid family serine protease